MAVAVFAGAGSYASPGAFADGFGPAIAASAGLSFAGALAGIVLRPRSSGRGGAGAVPALEAKGRP